MARSTSPSHRTALQALGLAGPAVTSLERYLDLLTAWNARIDLTAARTVAERVSILVEPALPLRALLRAGELIDVGSGNGSPGLILALLVPGLKTTLLEPKSRRWAFLREAARAGGRPDVRVLRLRHDGYAGPPAPNVTLRALRIPAADLAPLVAPGGQILLCGGPRPAEAPGFALESRSVGAGHVVHVLSRGGVPRET